jgi:hypothetical protein
MTATDKAAAPLIGCTGDVSAQIRDYCARSANVFKQPYDPNDVLSRRPGSPSVLLRYDRGNGDLTGWLPSTRHLDYVVGKGWIAVEMREA